MQTGLFLRSAPVTRSVRIHLLTLLIAVGFSLLIPVSAHAVTAWSPVLNVDPEEVGDDWLPVPIITPDNTAWIIWQAYDPVEIDRDIYYTRWNGTAFEAKQRINPQNRVEDAIPRASCSPDGTIWVLWKTTLDGSNYLGLASHWNGTGWTLPDTIWTDAGRYDNRDLYALSSSEAWFIRQSSGGDIIAYHLAGSVRDTTRFDLPNAVGYQPTIAVDREGVVWAAWTHEEAYPIRDRLEFSRRVGGVWSTPQILPFPVETKLPQLTVDKDDVKWIVAAGDDPNKAYWGDDIWTLRWNGSSWDPMQISEEIHSNDSLQVYNAVSRTPGEYPRVVWNRGNLRGTTLDILTSAWNGSSWSTPERVGLPADSMYVNWPNVAVRNGTTWVTWMGNDGISYVFNAYAQYSLRETIAAFSADFTADAIGAGVRLVWDVNTGRDGAVLRFYRAPGMSSQSSPPENTTLVTELASNRVQTGTYVDHLASGGQYTYWMYVGLPNNDYFWVGPHAVTYAPPGQHSRLTSAFPNPAGGETLLRGFRGLDVPQAVRIFDAQGRLVRELKLGPLNSEGSFTLRWDGLSGSGQRQPSGIYFAHLVTRGPQQSLKIMLIR